MSDALDAFFGLPAPLLLVIGGALLWRCSDWAVDHSVHLARSLRVSSAVVGAVILGFGTSLPELLVSLSAAFEGSPAIAFGNVVGSNVANVGLILGVGGIMAPLLVDRTLVRMHLPFGAVAAILVTGMAWDLEISRFEGILLLAGFGAYLALSLRLARSGTETDADEPPPERRLGVDLAWTAAGLAGITLGARVFVRGAVGTADLLGVPEDVIAVSMVAFGTSVPELVTTVQAARKGYGELAVGNVAGSNVFNLLLVLGTASTLMPIPVSESLSTMHAPAMCVIALLAFPLLGDHRSLGRGHGLALLGLYVAYIVYAFTG